MLTPSLYSQTVADGVHTAISKTLSSPVQVEDTILVPPALFGLVVTSTGGVDVYHV